MSRRLRNNETEILSSPQQQNLRNSLGGGRGGVVSGGVGVGGAEFDFKVEAEHLNRLVESTMKAAIESGPDMAEAGFYYQTDDLTNTLKELIQLDKELKRQNRIAETFTAELKGLTSSQNQNSQQSQPQSPPPPQQLADNPVIRGKMREMEDLSAVEGAVNWSADTKFMQFYESMWENGPGFGNKQPLPSLDAAVDGDDEGMSMEMRTSLICPISQGILVDPVVNRTCGHLFSNATILHLLRNSNGTIPCPVSGCRHTLSRTTLNKMPELETRIERVKSRTFLEGMYTNERS